MRKRVHSKALLFFVLAIAFLAWRGRGEGDCYPSSCGDIRNISSPFRLPDDPEHCGYPEYNPSCDSDQTVLYLYSQKFSVKAIDYENQVIQIAIPNLHSNDCSSFHDDALVNLFLNDPYMLPSAYRPYTLPSDCGPWTLPPGYGPYILPSAYYDYNCIINTKSIVFVNCSVPLTDDPSYCKANTTFFSSSSCNSLSIIWGDSTIGDLPHSCPIVGFFSFVIYIMKAFLNGAYDPEMRVFGHYYSAIRGGIVCLLLGGTFIGIICVIAFLLYKFRRRHIWMDTTVEEFLTRYRNHTPTTLIFKFEKWPDILRKNWVEEGTALFTRGGSQMAELSQ